MWPFDSKKPSRKAVSVRETMNSRHLGKAMCASSDDGVTIVTECITCGQVTTGPIHPLHLRSLAALIDQMADSLGLPSREDSISHRIQEEIHPQTPSALAEVQGKFNAMSMDGIKERFDAEDRAAERSSHGPSVDDIMRLLGKPGKVH